MTLAYLFAPDFPEDTNARNAGRGRTSRDSRPEDVQVADRDPETRLARDAAWVEQIRSGSRDAFAQLYSEYASAMGGFAFRFVRSVSVAEDITEDVFVALWERRHLWIPRHGARAYLFHAVRTRALNHLRDHATVHRLGASIAHDEISSLESRVTSVDEQLDTAQKLAAARAVIATLPEVRRRVMELRWYNGLAIEEIAAVMEVNRSAVDQHLSRGLRVLRKLLAPTFGAE